MSKQKIAIPEFRPEDIPLSCTWIIVGSPGSGKCKSPGTPVLLYSGQIVRAGDVKLGDCLMGDDSTPRKVVKLFSGKSNMYKIIPSDGTEPYEVTGGHTLCLRYNTRPRINLEKGKFSRYRVVYGEQCMEIIDGNPILKVKKVMKSFSITDRGEQKAKEESTKLLETLKNNYEDPFHEVEVEDYLNQSKSFNHRLVAYRSDGIEFENVKKQTIDPYLLGVWLGDGYSSSTQIVTNDKEISDYLYKESSIMGLALKQNGTTEHHKGHMDYRFSSFSKKKGDNIFLNFLKDNNLLNNKHIPEHYKVNTRENRLKLLAGLIDTDGHYANKSFYEIYQKNKNLANDIVFLARSLGFWCHIKPIKKGCWYKEEYKEGTYQKITLGGMKLEEIPVLLERKKAKIYLDHKQKNNLYYKFDVEYVGEKDYVGFELEGTNHRFLLGDFTITHNCLAPKTPVMMFDRTIKFVENIIPGDRLRGDDDIPRNVLSVCQGEDEMYEIQQSQGMNYTVNAPHILTLINPSTNISTDVELKKYLTEKDRYGELVGYRLNEESKIKDYSNICILSKGKGKYYGFQIDGNGRFLFKDGTVTHNSTLIDDLCYYLKHRYPVARVFMGTEAGYKKFCDIFHPLYVSNYYDEEEEKRHILRQRTCEIENGKGYPGNYAINIMDDVSDDPRIYKGKTMKGLFKLGSQHWNQLFMVGSQYAIDMPPDVRKSVSYAAIFFEPEEDERKKLYRNFGGLSGSYENFCDLMDQLTGDYTCLIFKKRTQTHNIEDNVSWFKTSILKPWKFGCKEYREWAKERYNTKYQEQILI